MVDELPSIAITEDGYNSSASAMITIMMYAVADEYFDQKH